MKAGPIINIAWALAAGLAIDFVAMIILFGNGPMTDMLAARMRRLELWAWGTQVPDRLSKLEDLEPSAELLAAAQAVIAQWDTPNWKLNEPTGKIINRLRVAVELAGGRPL